MIITKASGANEPFEKKKLRQSLLRAGASETMVSQVVEKIEADLTEGMTTKHIYKKAHRLLRASERVVAGRYHLKNGLMELGPSGFLFEMYVSQILIKLGYSVQVGKMVEGKCVRHEVDVIAEKLDQHFMIECKYHNTAGIACDVKIPLYIQARFMDVEAKWKLIQGHGTKFHRGWVVTNTRFTADAITYGSCCGLRLVSLDYPTGGSLRDMIEETGLYPLTCLSTLTLPEKKSLLQMKIILCQEICHKPQYLQQIKISADRVKEILEEGNQLCHKLTTHDQH